MFGRIARRIGILLIVAAVLVPAQGSAQERIVEGHVVSEDGTPLRNARVEVASSSSSWVLSGEDGSFRLPRSPEGTFDLLVSRPGHLTRQITVRGDETGTIVVTLPVDALAIPGIHVVGIRSDLVGKTRESVITVPQLVTVVDHTVFENQGARDLGDVVRNVAGIIQSDGSSGPGGFYSLRGFYSDSNGNFRKNGAQVFKSAELLQPNVDRVEVLKGPSSVFFGQLDPGGVVNLVTKRPQPISQQQMDVKTGSFGLIDGVADITGPLSDEAAFRVIAAGRRGGEFVTGGNRNRLFLAPSLGLSRPGRGTLDVEVELSHGSGVTNPGLKAPSGTFEGMDELPADLFLGDEDATYDRTQASVQVAGELEVSAAVQLRSLISLSRYDWSSLVTALRAFEPDERTLNRRAQQTDTEQTDVHVDLFGHAGFELGSASHKTTAGVDFQGSSFSNEQFRRDMDPIDILAPISAGVPAALDEVGAGTTDTDVLGGYLSHSIEFGRLRLLGGVRRTSFRQESQTGDVLEADDWSANAGVVVRLGAVSSLFSTFSQSFAPTLFTFDGNLFDPSFGTQYEVGLKIGLADGRVLGTVTYFDLENTGVLSFYLDENGDFLVEQGGTHGSRGIELEVNGRLIDRLYVLGSYAYLDGEVREDPAYDVGTPLGGSPTHSGSLWLDYQATSRLSLGGGVFHVDERKAFLSSQLFMPAHTLVDASIAFELTPDVDLRLVAKNLANARHYVGGSGPFARPGSTRSIVLEATARLR